MDFTLGANGLNAAIRGRNFESAIAAYFQHHGYEVRPNQVLAGRSGASHEIDVLAEKSDALTSFRVAIECKAWRSPIEKDVVSKLHYVMGDLGLHKGLVVSMAGARAGAEIAARELGIELWGPDELQRHLGDTIFAEVAAARPPVGGGRTSHGFVFRTSSESAEALVREAGKGRFGLRTLEELVWFAPIWLPTYQLRLTVTQPQVKRMRPRLVSTVVENLYEALTGEYLGPAHQSTVGQIALGQTRALKPILRDTQVQASIRKAADNLAKVTSDAAIQRHQGTSDPSECRCRVSGWLPKCSAWSTSRSMRVLSAPREWTESSR